MADAKPSSGGKFKFFDSEENNLNKSSSKKEEKSPKENLNQKQFHFEESSNRVEEIPEQPVDLNSVDLALSKLNEIADLEESYSMNAQVAVRVFNCMKLMMCNSLNFR